MNPQAIAMYNNLIMFSEKSFVGLAATCANNVVKIAANVSLREGESETGDRDYRIDNPLTRR